ncbi:MAG TPA: GDSL-type esterase/lipase family protein [Planctomycetota bacterium]|nr:GDSL-type esterase/lipase family protein [Planctomycetota bacterium]
MRVVSALLIAVLSLCLVAGEDPSVPAPRTKEYNWMSVKRWNEMHESFLKRAKAGKIDLLFLGDSITEGWGNNAVWQKNYAPLNAANFGIGGDVTQNVLWRITTGGELEGVSPKAVVLMIGTNNFGLHGDKEEDVVKGITTLVTTLRTKLPAAKILLLGIFPRDQKPDTHFRKKIKAVNDQISKLDNGKEIRYLDIGPKLLAEDGTLPKDIAPDFLHLSPKGYQIWADAINPLLAELMK